MSTIYMIYLHMNVTGDAILKCLKEINLYTKI